MLVPLVHSSWNQIEEEMEDFLKMCESTGV
jgi:hypothetical protein